MSFDSKLFLSNLNGLLSPEDKRTLLVQCALSDDELDKILKGEVEATLKFATVASSIIGTTLERLISKDLTKKRSDIKLLVLDIDGVLTEGGMYYTQSGDEFKRFNTRDGMAIKKLTKENFQVAFLSSGINDKLIQSRATLLGVQNVYVGLDKKLGILEGWRKEMNLSWEQIAYIGDDVNDLEVMKLCGFTACPADAASKVKAIADVMLHTNGGSGCVREFIEEYLIEV